MPQRRRLNGYNGYGEGSETEGEEAYSDEGWDGTFTDVTAVPEAIPDPVGVQTTESFSGIDSPLTEWPSDDPEEPISSAFLPQEGWGETGDHDDPGEVITAEPPRRHPGAARLAATATLELDRT